MTSKLIQYAPDALRRLLDNHPDQPFFPEDEVLQAVEASVYPLSLDELRTFLSLIGVQRRTPSPTAAVPLGYDADEIRRVILPIIRRDPLPETELLDRRSQDALATPAEDTALQLQRVTLNLTARTQRALASLIATTGDTKTDVINKAVQVYDYVRDLSDQGLLYEASPVDGARTAIKFV